MKSLYKQTMWPGSKRQAKICSLWNTQQCHCYPTFCLSLYLDSWTLMKKCAVFWCLCHCFGRVWEGRKNEFFILFAAEYGLRAKQVISNSSRTLGKKRCWSLSFSAAPLENVGAERLWGLFVSMVTMLGTGNEDTEQTNMGGCHVGIPGESSRSSAAVREGNSEQRC